MGKAESTHVRVKRATLDALKARIEALRHAVEMGWTDAPPGWTLEQINPAAGPLSLDQMIAMLLARDAQKRIRVKRSRAKRKPTSVDAPGQTYLDREELAAEADELYPCRRCAVRKMPAFGMLCRDCG